MMKNIKVNCEICGDRWEILDEECPNFWACENCKVVTIHEFVRCEGCGLYFSGIGDLCHNCKIIEKIDEEYRYRMAVGDIELELE